MSRCGRCKGRGWVRAIRGVGQLDCPACAGTGVKIQKSSLDNRSFSIPGPHGNCIVCGRPATEWHHVVSVSRLKRFVLAAELQAALTDPRNLVPLDRECHEKVERASLHLEPHELHPDFGAFIVAYNLEVGLPRHLACGAAVETSIRQGTVVSPKLRPSREESA